MTEAERRVHLRQIKLRWYHFWFMRLTGWRFSGGASPLDDNEPVMIVFTKDPK